MELNELVSQERQELIKSKMEILVTKFGHINKKDQTIIYDIRVKIFNKQLINKQDYDSILTLFSRYGY